MFFSIVVPVYNVEKYIVRCIDSLLNQTYVEFEIIIVDDETPDNSIKIIRENFNDPRIKIHHQKNGGLSSARNYGLNFVTGDYIWFIDSDDYVSDNLALEKIYKSIISHQQPQIVVFNNRVIFEDMPTKGWLNRNAPENTKILSGKEYIENYQILPINAWTQCYRADFFINNHFKFSEGTYFEDIYLNLDIYFKVETIVGIDACFINYIKRENSIMTARFNMQHLKSEIKVILKFDSFLKQKLFNTLYLKNRINYEFDFLKKIYTSCFTTSPISKISFKELKGIVIPPLETDGYVDKLEKVLFKSYPEFILKNQKNISLLNRIENKIKRMV